MDFRIEKKDKDGKVEKVMIIKGLDTVTTKEGNVKLKPTETNAAAFKGLLAPNSKLLGAMLNTYLPVWLRGKLDDGFKGTLAQAVEKASAGATRQSAKDAKVEAAKAAMEFIPKAKREAYLTAMGLTLTDLEEDDGEE